MFKNKVVLITGGSAGIGAATAEQFPKESAIVVIVRRNEAKLNEVVQRCIILGAQASAIKADVSKDAEIDTECKKGRNETKLKEVVQRCVSLGAQAFTIKADVSKDAETDTIVKQTVDKYGKIDVLVNNAGILRESDIQAENFLDTFDEVMNVNMRGPARITRHAVPHLIKSKGNIVNVSSIAAINTKRPNFIAYRTSKAAVSHFSRCCALELAKFGVRVNSVSPGPVITSIFEGFSVRAEDFKESTALHRVCESVEIADMIVYLASDKARGVTGSEHVLDNGSLLV